MKLPGPNLIYNISVRTKAFRIDSYCKLWLESVVGRVQDHSNSITFIFLGN